MRYFKGCLTTLVLLVLILTGVFFLLKNNIINRLEVLSNNSSKSWTECSKTIEEKNLKLLEQNLQKDSLNYMVKSYTITKDSLGFTINFTGTTTDWPQYEKTVDAMLTSFTFNK